MNGEKSVICCIAKAARAHFDAADANKPPQTREEFEIACLRVQYALTHLRRGLELYEVSNDPA